MSEAGAFTGLVEQIYDAAVEPDRWPAFLDSLRQTFQGGPVSLLVQDARSHEVGFLLVRGQDPAATESYREYYARTNGLSPAEARLAAALVAGRELPAYAEVAGITSETARGYLKSIFGKTGTSRQSALVAALLADPILRLAGRRLEK